MFGSRKTVNLYSPAHSFDFKRNSMNANVFFRLTTIYPSLVVRNNNYFIKYRIVFEYRQKLNFSSFKISILACPFEILPTILLYILMPFLPRSLRFARLTRCSFVNNVCLDKTVRVNVKTRHRRRP